MNQSCKNIEIQCIHIEKPNNKRLVLVNTYRLPRGCKINFIRLLKETLPNIPERNNIGIILTGDININLDLRDERVKDFKKLMRDFGLRILIKEYTCCVGNSKSILDVICTNTKFIWYHEPQYIRPLCSLHGQKKMC